MFSKWVHNSAGAQRSFTHNVVQLKLWGFDYYFLEHLTQLCAPGVTMFWWEGKNEIASKMIVSTWGKKRGGIQSQISICKKKIVENLKRCAWSGGGGGVSDVTPLSVKSQVFRTAFAYSQLFPRTNSAPTDSNRRKHLSGHFEVRFTVFWRILAWPGPLGQNSKIQLFLFNVTFLEQEVPEQTETSEY